MRAGRLLPDRNWGHYTLFDVTFIPDQMSVVELERRFRDLALVIYSASQHDRRFSIRRRVWANSRHAYNSRHQPEYPECA
jgi:hypothetical protein